MLPFNMITNTLKIKAIDDSRILSTVKGFIFALGFASLTGACSRLKFYLPFTPVPVTGQVFAVLLSGALLGSEYGALSQILYISLGLAGVPWFAVFPLVPTGGYLAGFIGAPYIIGWILKKSKKINMIVILLAMISGVFLIYLLGLLIFSLLTQKGILDSVRLAVLPFIPFDLGKAFLAALVVIFISGRSRRSDP